MQPFQQRLLYTVTNTCTWRVCLIIKDERTVTAVNGSVASKVQVCDGERHVHCAFTDRPPGCCKTIEVFLRVLSQTFLYITITLIFFSTGSVAKDTDHYDLRKPVDGQPLGALRPPVTSLTHLENAETNSLGFLQCFLWSLNKALVGIGDNKTYW